MLIYVHMYSYYQGLSRDFIYKNCILFGDSENIAMPHPCHSFVILDYPTLFCYDLYITEEPELHCLHN